MNEDIENIVYNYIKNNQQEKLDLVDVSVGAMIPGDMLADAILALEKQERIIRVPRGIHYMYQTCDGEKCKFCLKPTIYNVIDDNKSKKRCYWCGKVY